MVIIEPTGKAPETLSYTNACPRYPRQHFPEGLRHMIIEEIVLLADDLHQSSVTVRADELKRSATLDSPQQARGESRLRDSRFTRSFAVREQSM